MVSPTSRRRAVKYLVAEGLSTATQAGRALDLARSSYYLVSRKSPSSQKLNQKIVQLSEENPRYGYRRITALLRRRGRKVNFKRVQRVRREQSAPRVRRVRPELPASPALPALPVQWAQPVPPAPPAQWAQPEPPVRLALSEARVPRVRRA